MRLQGTVPRRRARDEATFESPDSLAEAWPSLTPEETAAFSIAVGGVVTRGSVAGSMLPFVLRRLGLDPARASAPVVATLVDVTGVVIYVSVAKGVLQLP